MTLPIILSPEADRDVENAAEWYEGEAALGTQFMARVKESLDQIGRMPELNAIAHRDIRRARVPRFPYHVFDRVLIDRVEVLAVVHGRRDPSVWQSRA